MICLFLGKLLQCTHQRTIQIANQRRVELSLASPEESEGSCGSSKRLASKENISTRQRYKGFPQKWWSLWFKLVLSTLAKQGSLHHVSQRNPKSYSILFLCWYLPPTSYYLVLSHKPIMMAIYISLLPAVEVKHEMVRLYYCWPTVLSLFTLTSNHVMIIHDIFHISILAVFDQAKGSFFISSYIPTCVVWCSYKYHYSILFIAWWISCWSYYWLFLVIKPY